MAMSSCRSGFTPELPLDHTPHGHGEVACVSTGVIGVVGEIHRASAGEHCAHTHLLRLPEQLDCSPAHV